MTLAMTLVSLVGSRVGARHTRSYTLRLPDHLTPCRTENPKNISGTFPLKLKDAYILKIFEISVKTEVKCGVKIDPLRQVRRAASPLVWENLKQKCAADL